MVNLSEVFTYDPLTGIVRWQEGRRRGGKPLATVRCDGYIRTTIGKKEYAAHQIAFFVMTGSIPKMVDHINGVRTDNRWRNLREASPAQNSRNRCAIRGLKGATIHAKTGKYQAQIKVGSKNIYLGLFETEKEANAAYSGAAKILFGEFARAA